MRRRRTVESLLSKKPPDGEASFAAIQWVTDLQLTRASQALRRLQRLGKRLEQNGDHFSSGHIAYELRQIVAEIRTLACDHRRGRKTRTTY